MNLAHPLIFVISAMLLAPTIYGTDSPHAPSLTWTSPSVDEQGSMPLGNGEMAANVWATAGGDLSFYLARTDAWSGNARLLKLGLLHVKFQPSPFAGGDFRQTLDAQSGTIVLEGSLDTKPFRATVWIDAHSDVLHVDARSEAPFSVKVKADPWRTEPREIDGNAMQGEIHSFFAWRGGGRNPVIEADKFVSQPGMDALIGYHRNEQSNWSHNLASQGLSSWAASHKDPLLHRTFGFLAAGPDLIRVSETEMATQEATTQLHLRCLTRTDQAESADDWVRAIVAEYDAIRDLPLEPIVEAHRAWWQEFWKRSWIRVSLSEPLYQVASSNPAGWQLVKPFSLGANEQGRNGFNGMMYSFAILPRELAPDAVGNRFAAGQESVTDEPGDVRFDFGIPGSKPGVYLDASGAWEARNRGQTELVTDTHGTGISFSGSDFLFLQGTPINFPSSALLEFWLVPAAVDRPATLLHANLNHAGREVLLLVNLIPPNRIQVRLGDRIFTANGAVSTGVLAHVCVSVNPESGDVTLFVNGVPVEWQQVTGDVSPTPTASANAAFEHQAGRVAHLSEMAAWQRYISACAGRGAFPIKFNGSLFTVRTPIGKENFDADYRRWGGPYWFQNTRLAYWPMLASGDFEMMQPFFQLYESVLPLAKARTREFFDHDGAYFFECMEFWGGSPEYVYGRADERASLPDLRDGYPFNAYHRYHFNAGLELSAMMLEYVRFTGDATFAAERAVPLADEVVTFFGTHYPRDPDGTLRITPSQALESWQDVDNPMTEVAGLYVVLQGLLALPESVTSAQQRTNWKTLLATLPPVPTRQADGEEALWVAEKTSKQPKNAENPELYAVFPFRTHGIHDPATLPIAMRAFSERRVVNHNGWSQDEVQAAHLGLADEAAQLLLQRASESHQGSRFPAFWGPNFDWVPDQDHGSNLLMALQFLAIQSSPDGKIRVLPAWPAAWNIDFRLHAANQTVIEGIYQDGVWAKKSVQPEVASADVVFLR